MFNFIRNLFGSKENTGQVIQLAGDAIRGVGNWIDNREMTLEERSKANLEAAQNYLKFVELSVNEGSVRSITRRWLAWAITAYVMFWGCVAMLFAIAGKEEVVNRMINVIESLQIGWAFTGVCALYFGVSLVRK